MRKLPSVRDHLLPLAFGTGLMHSRLVKGGAGRVFECMSKLVLSISFLHIRPPFFRRTRSCRRCSPPQNLRDGACGQRLFDKALQLPSDSLSLHTRPPTAKNRPHDLDTEFEVGNTPPRPPRSRSYQSSHKLYSRESPTQSKLPAPGRLCHYPASIRSDCAWHRLPDSTFCIFCRFCTDRDRCGLCFPWHRD